MPQLSLGLLISGLVASSPTTAAQSSACTIKQRAAWTHLLVEGATDTHTQLRSKLPLYPSQRRFKLDDGRLTSISSWLHAATLLKLWFCCCCCCCVFKYPNGSVGWVTGRPLLPPKPVIESGHVTQSTQDLWQETKLLDQSDPRDAPKRGEDLNGKLFFSDNIQFLHFSISIKRPFTRVHSQ